MSVAIGSKHAPSACDQRGSSRLLDNVRTWLHQVCSRLSRQSGNHINISIVIVAVIGLMGMVVVVSLNPACVYCCNGGRGHACSVSCNRIVKHPRGGRDRLCLRHACPEGIVSRALVPSIACSSPSSLSNVQPRSRPCAARQCHGRREMYIPHACMSCCSECCLVRVGA